MTRTILVALIAMALGSCSKSAGPDAKTDSAVNETGSAPAAAAVTSSASRDPCTLIDDPDAVFGQPVAKGELKETGHLKSCLWNNAAGMMCAIVTPMGADWNGMADVGTNYSGMVTSMGAFGKTQPVAGIGEEAVIVDGGILGVQIAFRTSKAAVNIGAACAGGAAANLELVQKVAKVVAAKL
jgi:hypothetical protein